VPNKDGRLVITHKDRLLRFGAELVFSLCAAKQVEVVILNQGEDTTFFSAQLYGKKWVKKFGPKFKKLRYNSRQ
jgi:predicted site-specific integrase-resolvase